MSERDRDQTIVELWISGKTLREIAKVVGISFQAVGGRIAYMRKLGVNLPRRAKGRPPINVAALNKLIKEHWQ